MGLIEAMGLTTRDWKLSQTSHVMWLRHAKIFLANSIKCAEICS
ncbi:hypothetical protein B0E55_04964 [Rhodococcus sp. 66b]|nr:hypothetical protein B0E55_04964 [Rhodococcus sp. 66b]